jgi:hypothetical protein
MAITRISNTRPVVASRKAKRLAAARRAKKSADIAVAVVPPSFKMRLLKGAAAATAAAATAAIVPLCCLLGSAAIWAKPSDSSELAKCEKKYKLRMAKRNRAEALREVARAEHALNMARIELDRTDAKLEQLDVSAPQSLWSKVSTAVMYVGVGAVMAYNPEATAAVAGACANAAVTVGRFALASVY